MECAASPSWLQLSGWIASILIAVIGFFFTTFGWKVRARQARELAHKKDTHASIDNAVSAIEDFVERSLSYWTEPETAISSSQLITGHRRVITKLRQVEVLTGQKFPLADIASLRKQATLDMENTLRPLRYSDSKVRKLIKSAETLLTSELLIKRW